MKVLDFRDGLPGGADFNAALTFDLDAESMWTSRDVGAEYRPSIMSQGFYDMNEGLDNVLSLLGELGVRSTFFIPIATADKYSAQVRRIVSLGHSVGVHGDTHVPMDPATPEGVERGLLQAWKNRLEDLCGRRVLGYRAPLYAVTFRTRELLAELGFVFSSNFMDSTRPYLVPTRVRSVVEFPVHWSLDDGLYLLYSSDPPNYRQYISSGAMTDSWRAELGAIADLGGLGTLTLHPQLIGRPGPLRVLRDLVEHFRAERSAVFHDLEELAQRLQAVAGE